MGCALFFLGGIIAFFGASLPFVDVRNLPAVMEGFAFKMLICECAPSRAGAVAEGEPAKVWRNSTDFAIFILRKVSTHGGVGRHDWKSWAPPCVEIKDFALFVILSEESNFAF